MYCIGIKGNQGRGHSLKNVIRVKYIKVDQKWHFIVLFESLFPLYLKSNGMASQI
jgi:hypothetical protein